MGKGNINTSRRSDGNGKSLVKSITYKDENGEPMFKEVTYKNGEAMRRAERIADDAIINIKRIFREDEMAKARAAEADRLKKQGYKAVAEYAKKFGLSEQEIRNIIVINTRKTHGKMALKNRDDSLMHYVISDGVAYLSPEAQELLTPEEHTTFNAFIEYFKEKYKRCIGRFTPRCESAEKVAKKKIDIPIENRKNKKSKSTKYASRKLAETAEAKDGVGSDFAAAVTITRDETERVLSEEEASLKRLGYIRISDFSQEITVSTVGILSIIEKGEKIADRKDGKPHCNEKGYLSPEAQEYVKSVLEDNKKQKRPTSQVFG